MSDREWAILSAGVLGRLEFALGDLDAALGYVRELPGELLSKGYKDPTAPVWGDAIEILIAGGELEQAEPLSGEYESNSSRAGSPWAVAVAARCRGLLAAAEDDLAVCRCGVRAISCRARGAAVPVRARPHAALPRHGASTGPTAEGRPRGAGGGARHLRGARRSPLDGEGPCRACAHQRPAHDVRRVDRDGTEASPSSPRAGTPTRRSPPSCLWE